jgi:hypothetical protein
MVLSLVCGGPPCTTRTIHPAAQWRRCHPEPELEKEGMDVTIVGTSRPVTGGVDTHLDVRHEVARSERARRKEDRRMPDL